MSADVVSREATPQPAERRPKFSKEIALLAGHTLARKLAAQGHIDATEVQGMANAIAMHAPGPYTDGYAIAKALDEYEGCDCNFEMAEILDEFSVVVADEIRIAEKAWAERTNPQPPLPIGARVSVRNETGEITEIYKYGVAQYCVKIDGDDEAKPPMNGRRIINFEDARAAS